MPEGLKQILVMQNWQHQLSHEIYHGILDHIAHRSPGKYVCSRLPWDEPSVWRNGHSWDVAAFIMPVLNQEKYDRIKKLGWKTISTHIGFPTPGIPQVDLDHAATGRMAAEYCLTLGHLQVAYVGTSSIQALLNRKQGFLDRMEEANREVLIYEVGLTLAVPPDDRPQINSWLSALPKPAVIYCSDDDLALEVANRCRHQNIAVPDEIAILGTQDDPALCRECIPGLSSVHLDYHKVGYEAMALTDRWLRTRKRPTGKIEIQPSHVAVRPSTDILSLPDPNVVKAVRLLRDRCSEQPIMADIAREAGMSLRLMQLRFKELLGHTPGEELRQARLERVKQLLRETSFGLEEVADLCGFANANTLCEQFKKETGMTPGGYRKS